MRNKSLKILGSAVALTTLLAAGSASAVPLLQLYIEGATYDPVQESWYTPSQDFYLWAIGNLNGPGGAGSGTISSVRLAAVYDTPNSPATITITPTLIGAESGSYMGYTDGSKPGVPSLVRTVSDGSTPLIGGNKSLPNHGEYGIGRTWQEFALGDLTIADSQLGEFINTFPVPGAPNQAQINAYHVVVNGPAAHFDLYADFTDARGRVFYIFAPPSHDATDGPATVPVPATLALLGVGALGLGFSRRKLAQANRNELPAYQGPSK